MTAHVLLELRNVVITQTHELLDGMLDSLIATPGLNTSQASVSGNGLTPEDRSAAHAKLAVIKDLVAKSDANATSLWEDHAPVLMGLISNGAEVHAAINGYDFELASESLRASEAESLHAV